MFALLCLAECSQAAMMSIAYKEGVSFPPAALNKVIVAANQDIRQVQLLLLLLLLLLILLKVKDKGQNVALKERTPHRAMERHLSYGITQCYLPPDRGERAPP